MLLCSDSFLVPLMNSDEAKNFASKYTPRANFDNAKN